MQRKQLKGNKREFKTNIFNQSNTNSQTKTRKNWTNPVNLLYIIFVDILLVLLLVFPKNEEKKNVVGGQQVQNSLGDRIEAPVRSFQYCFFFHFYNQFMKNSWLLFISLILFCFGGLKLSIHWKVFIMFFVFFFENKQRWKFINYHHDAFKWLATWTVKLNSAIIILIYGR